MTKRERYLARGLAITVVTTVLISMIGNDQSVARPLIAAALGAIVTLLVQPKTGLGAAAVGEFSRRTGRPVVRLVVRSPVAVAGMVRVRIGGHFFCAFGPAIGSLGRLAGIHFRLLQTTDRKSVVS